MPVLLWKEFGDAKRVVRIVQWRRVDNIMVKRKSTKGQTTIYKTYTWHQRSSSNLRFWLPCKRYIFGMTNWLLHIWLAYKNHKNKNKKRLSIYICIVEHMWNVRMLYLYYLGCTYLNMCNIRHVRTGNRFPIWHLQLLCILLDWKTNMSN
jgi:hypothetical protein